MVVATNHLLENIKMIVVVNIKIPNLLMVKVLIKKNKKEVMKKIKKNIEKIESIFKKIIIENNHKIDKRKIIMVEWITKKINKIMKKKN